MCIRIDKKKYEKKERGRRKREKAKEGERRAEMERSTVGFPAKFPRKSGNARTPSCPYPLLRFVMPISIAVCTVLPVR